LVLYYTVKTGEIFIKSKARTLKLQHAIAKSNTQFKQSWRGEMPNLSLEQKLEQREDFINDVYALLKNSNSKAAVVEVLLHRTECQINAQKLGII